MFLGYPKVMEFTKNKENSLKHITQTTLMIRD